MLGFRSMFENIQNGYNNPGLNSSVIGSVLLMVLLLCAWEFIVYRLVSHRAFYNRSFNISIAVLPFFIATIILCLQSNIVITLGTIGALAIIRFRTAVKDPVDMLYLLWSIHTGIVCGCQLYEVAVLTSLVVTIILLVLENVPFGKAPFIVVFHCPKNEETKMLELLEKHAGKVRVKSRNFTGKEMNYVLEISAKDPEALTEAFREGNVDNFSILEYDSDDIL